MPRRERRHDLLRALLAATLLVAVAACAPPRPPLIATETAARATDASVPEDFPLADYRTATAAGARVYRVDPARSRLVILVRRGGPLARLGHDHVVSSHDLAGYIAPDDGRADLAVPLARLVVDDAVLREAHGLDTTPSAADIAGTRANMLNKVLEVGMHPWARARISAADLGAQPARFTLALTLHGATRTMPVTAEIVIDDAVLSLGSRFELAQSEFGIAPFAVLGGALKVEDKVVIEVELKAHRQR